MKLFDKLLIQKKLEDVDWDIIKTVKDGVINTKRVLFKGDSTEIVFDEKEEKIDDKVAEIDKKIADLETEKDGLINLNK